MNKQLFALLFSVLVLLFMSGCNGVTDSDEEHVASFETYTISPEGGTHMFDCGMTIDVPEGALTAETEIQFRKMKRSEVHTILEPLGRESSDILAGFEAGPDGLTFSEPVKVTIHDAGLKPGDFVIMHELDVENGTYTLAELSFVVDPAEDIIELSLEHFSGYSAEQIEERKKTECKNDPDNCRCKGHHVKQSDPVIICGKEECQKTESMMTVEYPACGITETHYIYELSEGCEPKISLTAGSKTIRPKGHTTVTAEVILGCEGLEGQVVDFSISNNVSLGSVSPTNRTTGPDGKAQTTFTAGEEEGTVTVTVNATVSYYMSIQETHGEAGDEITKGPMKTKTVSADIDVTIEEAVWEGNFKASFTGCNYYVCIYNYSVEVDFTIIELDEPIKVEGIEFQWMGDATVTQSGGNITAIDEDLCIMNFYMNDTFETEAFGSRLKGTNEIAFEFLTIIILDHFDFDLCTKEVDYQGEHFYLGGGVLGFAETPETYPIFNIVLEGDEVTKSGTCILGIWFSPPYIWGPYTLTIKKKK